MFADKVWRPEYADVLNEDQPSRGKYVKRLNQAIRKNADDEKLRGLLVKLQEYVAARRHDFGTTRKEAKRLVLFTYIVISELYEALSLTDGSQ